MLIEKEYRGTKAVLAYNGLAFSVPKNVYIIGMMNTADRSLAMIDYALRRRFSFYSMEPGFTSEGFQKYMKKLDNETFNLLIDKVMDLNTEIIKDSSLGSGFCIGHSYFCNQTECTDEWMQSVVEYDIMKCSLSGNTWSGSTWDGKSKYTKKTQEQNADGSMVTIMADFRKYPCIEDSIADHSAYLLGAKNGKKLRYDGLKRCTDYKKAVQIIKDGGYATRSTCVR